MDAEILIAVRRSTAVLLLAAGLGGCAVYAPPYAAYGGDAYPGYVPGIRLPNLHRPARHLRPGLRLLQRTPPSPSRPSWLGIAARLVGAWGRALSRRLGTWPWTPPALSRRR